MKKITIIAALVSLSACSVFEPAEVGKCEDNIKSKLRSPSTYKRVGVTILRENDSKTILIDYDAANAYGTPIRNTDICEYKNGVDQSANNAIEAAEQASIAAEEAMAIASQAASDAAREGGMK